MASLTAELEAKMQSLASEVSKTTNQLDAKLEQSREAASAHHASTSDLSRVEAFVRALEEKGAATQEATSSRLMAMEKGLSDNASATSTAIASLEKLQGEVQKESTESDLAEKVKAVETRQAKVTKHIVELSKRVSASAEDARGHEDSLRRHITETVAPLWETMNMLSRRIDCIM